jgi:hypothetical protein
MDDGRLERIERRMEELDQRESAMEKAMDKAMKRSKAAMAAVVPNETRSHVRASLRHDLLAIRSMLDHWAARLDDGSDNMVHDDKPTGGQDSSSSGRENIPID